MLFKIISAQDALAIELAKIDVIRLQYNSDDLSEHARHLICFYPLDSELPVAEFDITRLTLEQRHELFDQVCRYKVEQAIIDSTYIIR